LGGEKRQLDMRGGNSEKKGTKKQGERKRGGRKASETETITRRHCKMWVFRPQNKPRQFSDQGEKKVFSGDKKRQIRKNPEKQKTSLEKTGGSPENKQDQIAQLNLKKEQGGGGGEK